MAPLTGGLTDWVDGRIRVAMAAVTAELSDKIDQLGKDLIAALVKQAEDTLAQWEQKAGGISGKLVSDLLDQIPGQIQNEAGAIAQALAGELNQFIHIPGLPPLFGDPGRHPGQPPKDR